METLQLWTDLLRSRSLRRVRRYTALHVGMLMLSVVSFASSGHVFWSPWVTLGAVVLVMWTHVNLQVSCRWHQQIETLIDAGLHSQAIELCATGLLDHHELIQAFFALASDRKSHISNRREALVNFQRGRIDPVVTVASSD